jgi:glycogen debranching enzyme
MVGGFHALAARAAGRDQEADQLASALADACVEDGEFTFPEWRHGRTGVGGGARSQAWSAAAVLLAR